MAGPQLNPIQSTMRAFIRRWGTGLIVFFAFIQSVSAEPDISANRFQVETTGKGRNMMIIPGLASSPDVFKGVLGDAVKTGNTIHWITLGGFDGAPTPEPLSPFVQPAADALTGYVRENKFQKVALIGHSMGCVLSLLIAAQHPDAIDRILIIDSVPFLAALMQPGVSTEQMSARRIPMQAQFDAMSDEQFIAVMRQGLPIQATSAEAQAQVFAGAQRSDRRAIAVAMSEVFTTDYRSLLPQIKAKVTVLVPHNSFSPGTSEQILERYRALYEGLENVEFKLVENSRHFIMLDQPQAFREAVDQFLQGDTP